MSDIPSFPYDLLWAKGASARLPTSRAPMVTRSCRLQGEVPLEIETSCYALTDANRALGDLRDGRVTGAAVLCMR
jgi:propanol-preferring alcohol dehydrogenase